MSFLKKQSFPVCAAVGAAAALMLTALLLLPGAWAVSGELLPQEAGTIYAPAAAGIAVLIVTAVIGKFRGREVLAIGGAVAGGTVLLAALACALSGEKAAFGLWLAWQSGAAAAGALAGTLLTVRHNAHRRRRH